MQHCTCASNVSTPLPLVFLHPKILTAYCYPKLDFTLSLRVKKLLHCQMSFCQLPLELRHEIYSYLVFDTLESPNPPPLIQIVKPNGSSRLSHRHCKLHASTKEIYEHFAHKMIDPVQAYGSMFMEYGSSRPYLSTPRLKTCDEKTLDISDNCGCRGDPPPSGHAGLPNIFSVLVTSRQFADEVRAWLYPQIVFDFPLDEAVTFGLFTANLLPGTRELVRAVRLTMPIYNGHALYKQSYLPGGKPVESNWMYITKGFDWRTTIPSNLNDVFPSIRALHVNIWHVSRRLYSGGEFSGLAAPIGDEKWRQKALEPVLRFALLPLEEVTVVVDNVWPRNEIWSGDPRVQERRELANWLRNQLLDA